jgi:hypothetical protein
MAAYVLITMSGACLAKRWGKRFQKFCRVTPTRESERPPHRVPGKFFAGNRALRIIDFGSTAPS